jgi:hypothetical protein
MSEPVLPIRGVEGAVPVPVQITNTAPLPAQSQPSVAPKTTEQEDLVAAGQRHINVKWESTQQVIAIAVAVDALVICSFVIFYGDSGLKQAAFLFVTNLAFLVVGTYFQRTNHTKTGGVGHGQNETER